MKLHVRVKEIEKICDYEFHDKELIVAAITHASAVEGKPVTASYERLEFLGDSVLGSLVATNLYKQFPRLDEGGLTRIKTALISGKTLADVAKELGVGPLIIFGDSELGTGARGMRKALEDVYEALVGALYVDGGVEAAKSFVERTLMPRMQPSLANHPVSWKSRLQEVVQRDFKCGPTYKIVGQEGLAHTPIFTAVAFIESKRVGRGKGSTKKEAEGQAAMDALRNLGYIIDGEEGADYKVYEAGGTKCT